VYYRHLENSVKIAKMLEEKVLKFDYAFQKKCMESRDYEALEMYILELLMKG
jgi:xylose isomerase